MSFLPVVDSSPKPSSLTESPPPAHPLIDTLEGVSVILPVLAEAERVALDTEADSLHSYFEKLCLIQISVPGHDLLIDPLVGHSLEPLYTLLSGKRLVLHGADYDLRLLRRGGFERPKELFDTMIAARLCGYTEFSLAALIERHFGIQLVKGSQKADWGKRPLSPQMSSYAVNDTRYLLELAEILGADLRERGRWAWFEQSCEKAIASASVVKERDPESLWRVAGCNDLTERGQAYLRALWHWREQEAQQVDRPTFHILHNQQLVDGAARLDRGLEVHFHHLRGSRLRRFQEACTAALQLTPEDWPKTVRKPRIRATAEQEARFRDLRKKRDAAAAELQLDPSLIAPKATLERLAYAPEESAGLMLWQREVMGLSGDL